MDNNGKRQNYYCRITKRVKGERNHMKLRQGVIGEWYVVDSMQLPLQTERRLEALGMTRGTPILVLNKKNHGTVVIQVRGTRFALGHGITKQIQVVRTKEEEKTDE